MTTRYFVITTPQGYKVHFKTRVAGTLKIVPAPGMARRAGMEGQPEDSIHMRIRMGNGKPKRNEPWEGITECQPYDFDPWQVPAPVPGLLTKFMKRHGCSAQDFAFDSDYFPILENDPIPEGYPDVPIQRISGVAGGAPELFNVYAYLALYEHSTHPKVARERYRNKKDHFGIPGKILKRLLEIGWTTMEEYRERLTSLDWESFARYEALCRTRIKSGKPGFLPDGQYPWRTAGIRPPMLMPERPPRTDCDPEPLKASPLKINMLKNEYRWWHSWDETERQAHNDSRRLERIVLRLPPPKGNEWEDWELSEAEREWLKYKTEAEACKVPHKRRRPDEHEEDAEEEVRFQDDDDEEEEKEDGADNEYNEWLKDDSTKAKKRSLKHCEPVERRPMKLLRANDGSAIDASLVHVGADSTLDEEVPPNDDPFGSQAPADEDYSQGWDIDGERSSQQPIEHPIDFGDLSGAGGITFGLDDMSGVGDGSFDLDAEFDAAADASGRPRSDKEAGASADYSDSSSSDPPADPSDPSGDSANPFSEWVGPFGDGIDLFSDGIEQFSSQPASVRDDIEDPIEDPDSPFVDDDPDPITPAPTPSPTPAKPLTDMYEPFWGVLM
ncbi:uncharacterized protein SCHCODRAFT_02491955 [Schizophyllum commune H4-8]|uniref:Uncharacterized protein n=1 Tax=Schizophyllum commune (strain H4-8 / FGSC 9210) TaxID=578458 RepID=D8PXG8_SCHCM|nr:uncharacterized protein SCHCODRAFT_02491955 [Schizophyllum commune H4-8]KAI5896910.1 hypothetical protein SCHCODRAFT_02491955 [Schizophyllum commune H4-8]